jgi:hypothetical protein
MRVQWIVFMVLLFFCVQPHFLYGLDTLSGRILLLIGVVYLARHSTLLGFTAAVLMVRVLDQHPKPSIWYPTPNLLDLETLMRPKNSAALPILRTTDVPVNDIYEPYTFF